MAIAVELAFGSEVLSNSPLYMLNKNYQVDSPVNYHLQELHSVITDNNGENFFASNGKLPLEQENPVSIQVFVNTLQNGTILLHIDPNSSIADLKQAIYLTDGILPKNKRLVHGCREYLSSSDNNLRLADTNISNNTTISTLLSLHGGILQTIRIFSAGLDNRWEDVSYDTEGNFDEFLTSICMSFAVGMGAIDKVILFNGEGVGISEIFSMEKLAQAVQMTCMLANYAIKFTIRNPFPDGMSYGQTAFVGEVGRVITAFDVRFSPQNPGSGVETRFFIDAKLPNGIELNPYTGQISGKPIEEFNNTKYTVTCEMEDTITGQHVNFTANITIEVQFRTCWLCGLLCMVCVAI